MKNEKFRLLKEAIQHLADSYESQCGYLRSLSGDHLLVEELALEFDDIAPAFLSGQSRSAIGEGAAVLIQQLSNLLAQMSTANNVVVWTEEGLRDSPAWSEVRTIAALCVRSLPINIEDQ